ncbi:Lrp/AsnC family transcriptional regulator [Notoacmeibacter ruber]|uniref:Lrp/AsnC family transcriptional regulator n=1 Tax=Notoacmeibacter ruber TaxID=2670375 RepID=A0A3L7JFU0_9HYPH|nr:Lrp/AsnC family transcriptional regulator [Notoacmeibacter ruber]RLQ88471.1 Lrp/AsnC family transcriptional regulator [Notoacmeibacter ruber]
MDRTDAKLLRMIQRDSHRGMQALGEAVGLSASACHRRIKTMEKAGIIEGYRAMLSASALGFSLIFFVEVSLSTQSEAALRQFEEAVRNAPEILECHLMAGTADYVLRIVARDADDFERVHRKVLSSLPNVTRLQSNMIIRTVKTDPGLPI